ncbi:MAG: pyruvate kinase [Candidatus Peribacteria bacterium]|nr:pyruvate kinase [Candidatus Peribacteria bacterium]
MRLTKIICTLGPASNSPEGVTSLAKAGMNIARLNFSHGSLESHRETIKMLRGFNDKGDINMAIMLDTKGSEIRTGDVETPITITKGQEVIFSYEDITDTKGLQVIKVNYPEFAKDVQQAKYILLDNGELFFDIVKATDTHAHGRAQGDGSIGSRRHINLPGAHVSLPSVTEKDYADIAMGCQEQVDFVALSFVRTAQDIREVREFIKKNNSTMQIIAKIENDIAVQNIAEIIQESDAVMVARGDLGAEIPIERVPAIQDEIVLHCREAGKPVIVATHMLESMILHPLPTRAEVTDIAHAAVTGTDTTMLSGEMAAGKYPVESLEMMARVLVETETHMPTAEQIFCHEDLQEEPAIARALAAVTMATALENPLIVVLSQTGTTARALSRCRSAFPIVAFTADPLLQRRMQILFGVQPLLLPYDTDPETTIQAAFSELKKRGIRKAGDKVVLLSKVSVHDENVNSIQVRTVS